MKQNVRTGPKRLRYVRSNDNQNQHSRWSKKPGNYTPNIERAAKLAPQKEDYTL